MPRKFSVWKKKLGHRQSGSQLLSGIGGVIFFAAITIVGCILLTVVVTYQIQNWIAGNGNSWWSLLLWLLPISTLVGVGVTQVAAIVFSFGASAERRSAFVKRATELNVIGDSGLNRRDFPYVPRDTNITNSPGTWLKYRLPIMQLSAWRFFAISVLCLILVVIAAALFMVALSNTQLSRFTWATWGMSIVFFIGAGLAIYMFLWELLTYSQLGPTCIEISDHPLVAGKTYQLFLSQAGRMRLEELELKVVCKEEATYQQGTDIRTETKIVRNIRVFNKREVKIDPDLPYETNCEFVLPVDAMHSFNSSHNTISWTIIVDGEIEGRQPFQRTFPIVVDPIIEN